MSEKFQRKPKVETLKDRINDSIDRLRQISVEKAEVVLILQSAVTEALKINEKNPDLAKSVNELIAEIVAEDTDNLDQVHLIDAGAKVAVDAIQTLYFSADVEEDMKDKYEIVRDFKAIVRQKLRVTTPGGETVDYFDSKQHG